MVAKTFGSAVHGVDARTITVEVNVTQGQKFWMSGLPDTAVKESAHRVESSLKNLGYFMPRNKVVVNLAPRLPHRIISIVKTGQGTLLLTFLGTSNAQYVVQSSSNCLNWVSVQTNTAGSDGTWTYTESNAVGSGCRYYRSVQP